jgi:outer membrane receptor protein involved in Fe transport
VPNLRQRRAVREIARRLLKVALASAAFALGATTPLQAAAPSDTTELESLLATPVYAASKYQQSVADAPAAVTIITQGEIRAFGWRTLAEALNAVRGVYTRYDRGYTYVGVRGLSRPGDYSSRLLLLVDGVRVNDNVYDSVMTGREAPLDIELIERIEFIPGPGSAVHGSNAVLGTINLVTRSAASMRGLQGTAAVDSQSGWKLGASTTSESARGSLLLAASFERRPGQTLAFPEFDSPAHPGGVVRGQDGESAARLFMRFEAGNWTVDALGGRLTKEVPNAPFGLVFGDPAAEWTDRLALVGLNWHPAKVDGEGWYAQLGLGSYAYGDYGRYEPDQALLRNTNRGMWAHGELNHTLRLGRRQLLLLGMDLQRDLRQKIGLQMLEPVLQPVDTVLSTQGTRFGLYASDDIKVGDSWRVGLGLRLDRSVQGDWTATPRLSLLWHPAPKLTVKALRGDAFRSPNIYEAVSTDGGANLGRERTTARELVADWQAATAWRLSASLYRYDVSDMIEQLPDDSGAVNFANVSNARARGIELEAEYLAAAGLRVRSSIARQDTVDESGRRLSNSPVWLGKLHATAPLRGTPLRGALELQGMGPRITWTGATLASQVLANVSLGWSTPGQRWSANLTVHNVFDRKVFDPAGSEFVSDRVAQDGREATLRLHFTF